ncbi:MAG: hypothetical protein PSU94_09730 [Lacunisphaera sp.]|nr:hypothetical protein [Lacunisphaera sp.]
MKPTPRDFLKMVRQEIPIMWENCESPIEDAFLWDFHKVVAPGVLFHRQYHCRTQGKDYRVDFVFIGPSPKQQIGIE